MSIISIMKRFKRNQDGNFSIMGAGTILALILAVSLSLDSTSLFQKRDNLQSMSDSIALAAFQSGETDPKKLTEIANNYLASRYDAREVAAIEIVNIEHLGTEVAVTLTQAPSSSGLFLEKDVNVGVSSVAGTANSSVNIALVVDSTGSMRRSGKIDTLRQASSNLIDKLQASPSQTTRMSVVPFAQYINVGTQNSFAPWIEFPNQQDANNWDGCVGSRSDGFQYQAAVTGNQIPAFAGIECGAPIQPLTNDLELARRSVNNLETKGWTYLPAGLAWGMRTLNPAAPFTEAATAAKPGQQTKSVMIFMTDGENTRGKNGMLHDVEARQNRNADAHDEVNAATEEMCDAVKSGQITLYTIAFRVNDNTTRNLLEGCATSSEHYFNASNNAKLIEAFNAIGEEVGDLRLTN